MNALRSTDILDNFLNFKHMPSFRSAKQQSLHVSQNLRDKNAIAALGTQRNYAQSLKLLTKWLQQNKKGELKSVDKTTALTYLLARAKEVGQSQLDQDRQAIQAHLGIKIKRLLAEDPSRELAESTRSYTDEQIGLILTSVNSKTSLSIRLVYLCGLRAHELFTILPKEERDKSPQRPWRNDRFTNMESGASYTIVGKGGLIREIQIPYLLAQQLELKRLDTPTVVTDRGIQYESSYDLLGGQALSQAFKTASDRMLGWSKGLHGLRHSYAQQRLSSIQQAGKTIDAAKLILSQELGHFRPDITNHYLR